jgi:hypothetical protein
VVQRDDAAFRDNDNGRDHGHVKAVPQGGYGQSKDASCKDRPHHLMKQLNDRQPLLAVMPLLIGSRLRIHCTVRLKGGRSCFSGHKGKSRNARYQLGATLHCVPVNTEESDRIDISSRCCTFVTFWTQHLIDVPLNIIR